VSVDTNTSGKNLTPYRRFRVDDMVILIPRELTAMAQSMSVDVSGGFRKKLAVQFSDGSDSCAI